MNDLPQPQCSSQIKTLYSQNLNAEKNRNLKLVEFTDSFNPSILQTINSEFKLRENFKRKIVILGLRNTGGDIQKFKRLFYSLNQPCPTKFNRLKSINSNYPAPVVCELRSEENVNKILRVSYKLKSNGEFKNFYINQQQSVNQRLLNSIDRQKRKLSNGQNKQEFLKSSQVLNQPTIESKTTNKS
ncbi:unnamed protein product, partial [Brachionus calyciflorus]